MQDYLLDSHYGAEDGGEGVGEDYDDFNEGSVDNPGGFGGVDNFKVCLLGGKSWKTWRKCKLVGNVCSL